jgi:hypothetical protein
MKVPTRELSGSALDWAVAHVEGISCTSRLKAWKMKWGRGDQRYSKNWALGGPIIEREKIGLREPKNACKPDGTIVLYIDYWHAFILKSNGDRRQV